ncbi:MAG: DNA gyrase subunit A [Myxococcota bacterium]|nr:DNA gyrase subunit A [Deltaproteobacteria bacterium]MCP4241064.1 DNA gyrase subunit A [bacterium]MDP6076363.1 DNA gyrase subunit A [Myxococcota bacterium]MDP6242091.1 DNA gyrase subunit A [Myxococcota bacterium]MDP7074112.1 DNA gyrase subunit A [Myxococcota bacterium]
MADDPSNAADPTAGGPPEPPAPPVAIEDEVRRSFLAYSMSVIISRALPDVRDGLKPVHRRILYAMQQEGLLSNRAYSKSVGVVGEVLKHYHPHGDSAVYDAMVRMAQDFSLRYPLVDGQGNFGSVDGDSAAAYRYTEARLNALAEEMLRDIDRETVDFVPNFDGSTEEPVVLPSRFPNLLANGSSGIAVGMATNVPPHNLRELIDAVVLEAREPECTLDDLLECIPGPDFPTGAIICGTEGIRSAYATGRGLLAVRARAEFEETRKGMRIVVTEIPFMVNKSSLLERIADLVRDGKIHGVTDLRDESNRDGMRVVVELRRDAPEEVVLNQLYKQTPLQSTFGVNLLALVNGRPQLLSLKEALRHFIDFRGEVVVRRATYDLAQARARAHLLEGFAVALENLDEVIAIIRGSAGTPEARAELMGRFELSELQANAILDMRLRSLTQLERDRVLGELEELRTRIGDLEGLLASDERILSVIIEELEEIREKFGDERRTEIGPAVEGIDVEDLIVEEDMVVTVSHAGYIKRNPLTQYRAQRRGGKGVKGMAARDEDFVEQLFVASTHAYLLFFTTLGRVHWLKVHELPQLGRAAKGRALSNVLRLQEGERVQALLPVRSFEEGGEDFVVLGTRRGVVKKTKLSAYANPRRGGIIAINLDSEDELIAAMRTDGSQQVIIASKRGKSIRFAESEVRPMGRTAAGVRGMALGAEDEVVGMDILSPGATVLTVTERGYGKRTPLDDYRVQRRGGRGVITIRATARNGNVVGIAQVVDDDEVMLITDGGKVLRCKVGGISTMGRATQGVRLMNLAAAEKLVSIARLAERDVGDADGGTE